MLIVVQIHDSMDWLRLNEEALFILSFIFLCQIAAGLNVALALCENLIFFIWMRPAHWHSECQGWLAFSIMTWKYTHKITPWKGAELANQICGITTILVVL